MSFSGKKWCRIIRSFRQNTISGPETCQIGPKLWLPSCPDLPRPVQEDKYLLQTSGNTFIFSDFIKSSVLLNKFIIFYKIISFIKQIGPKVWNRTCPDLPRPAIKISRFTTFIFLLIVWWFSIKIISFLKYLRNKFRQQYLGTQSQGP